MDAAKLETMTRREIDPELSFHPPKSFPARFVCKYTFVVFPNIQNRFLRGSFANTHLLFFQTYKMYVLKAKPNGSCLFISLRLGLECSKLLKVQTPGIGLVDGFDQRVVDSAERLRAMIVDWYSNGLSKCLPGFESNGQSKPGQDGTTEVPWTRADLIAMETSNLTTQDIPEAGPERLALVLRYLEHVKKARTWGGAPEYTAFSYMSKLNVEVWSPGQHGSQIKLYQKIVQPANLGTVRLLHNGSCHYDLLLNEEDASSIMRLLPSTKLSRVA